MDSSSPKTTTEPFRTSRCHSVIRSVPCASDLMSVRLMDEQQTARFESACIAAGARFSGGVFACAALAEHELTGAETYYGITPSRYTQHSNGLYDNGLVHRLCSDHRPCRRNVFR